MRIIASLVVAASLAAGGGLAQATTTTTVYFQGTGDTRLAPAYIYDRAKQEDNKLINASTDAGWQADFYPVQGEATMDESVLSGISLTQNSVKEELAAGNRVVVEGFSLGSLAAGDLGVYLAGEGVDISNTKITMISDGHTPNTGALVVLEKIKLVKPVLDFLGITAGPRVIPSIGIWEYDCVNGDIICDTPDMRDPIGLLDAALGYILKHGGVDPKYNYRNLSELEYTSYVDGNVTTKAYHAPRSIPRAVELVTGSVVLSARLDALIEKLVTSKGDPGQEKTYKTIPETIRDVASIFDPEAPLLPTTMEEVPAFVGDIAEELVLSGTPKVGGIVGQAVGSAVGTQLAGPAGGVFGGEVGLQTGEFVGTVVGNAAAPYVGDAVAAGTQSLIEGNPGAVNAFIEQTLPGAPLIPTEPIVLPQVVLPPLPALL